MKTKYQICNNCKHQNPQFALNCEKCDYLIRDKVVNIDFWNIFALLVEYPTEAFTKIIRAEHKNFLNYLFLFVPLKILMNMLLVSLALRETIIFENWYIFISIGGFITMIFIWALLEKLLLLLIKARTRWFDNVATIVYSFIPLLPGLLIFSLLEFVVFGDHLFDNNPSPFQIKNFFAWMFLVIEALLIIWTLFLSAKAVYIVSKSYVISILFSLFVHGTIYTIFLVSIIYSNSVLQNQ